MRHRDGSMTPVELLLRPIVFSGRPHHVVAVRDLQARKEAEQHIHYLAHHDALTSVPNRSYFNARIDQEIAGLSGGESLAVLCLDLDRFKEVNDLFGHAAGDTVLQTVASRVTAVLGERQMIARLGGDEFAILMPGVKNPAAAGRLAETVLEALRAASDTPETNSISTSIGIAICPERRHGPRIPAQPRRHRAVPRQDRRPQHLSLLRGQHGRRGARTPHART